MKEHKFDLKRRESKSLPKEKLLDILRKIYPQELADKKYEELTGEKLMAETGGMSDGKMEVETDDE